MACRRRPPKAGSTTTYDNGYSFEIEPDFDIPKRPDRLIERVGFQAVCEIKEFTTDAMQRRWPEGGSRIGSFGSTEWFLTVRRQISAAAEQLEPLQDLGLPLVIVLANPRAQVLPLDPAEVIFAMYGDPVFSFTIDPATGAPASEPVLITSQHGRLAEGEGGWISAVAVLHRRDREADWVQGWTENWNAENWPAAKGYDEVSKRWEARQADLKRARLEHAIPEGEYSRLDVIETASDEAVAFRLKSSTASTIGGGSSIATRGTTSKLRGIPVTEMVSQTVSPNSQIQPEGTRGNPTQLRRTRAT